MRPWTLAALLAAGCAASAPPPATPPPAALPSPPDAPPPAPDAAAPAGPGERGLASYYSDRLAGRSTASGEPYDPRALTAAHRKLPFGTVVDVVRPDGRRVRVRINDRGPFKKGRVIDLSRKAAEAIGLLREGIAKVTVVVVSMPAKTKGKGKRKR